MESGLSVLGIGSNASPWRVGVLLNDGQRCALCCAACWATLFLQLLDRDAYADVKSIREAMDRRRAPFYLRRTKEAMVYFPERQENGSWAAKPVFTKRMPHTADFALDGPEMDLYQTITRFVKRQSVRAAAQGDEPRARAVGFLMALYQRRLASSTYAMRRSFENRVRRLAEGLKSAHDLLRTAPPDLPDQEEMDELEDAERERVERILEAITLAGNEAQVWEEIAELRELAAEAQAVEGSGSEAKLALSSACCATSMPASWVTRTWKNDS